MKKLLFIFSIALLTGCESAVLPSFKNKDCIVVSSVQLMTEHYYIEEGGNTGWVNKPPYYQYTVLDEKGRAITFISGAIYNAGDTLQLILKPKSK